MLSITLEESSPLTLRGECLINQIKSGSVDARAFIKDVFKTRDSLIDWRSSESIFHFTCTSRERIFFGFRWSQLEKVLVFSTDTINITKSIEENFNFNFPTAHRLFFHVRLLCNFADDVSGSRKFEFMPRKALKCARKYFAACFRWFFN